MKSNPWYKAFSQSKLTAGLILLAVAVGLWVFWQTFVVWLAAFLAITFAVVLHGVARLLQDRFKLAYGWALVLVLLLLLAAAAGLGLWLGPALVSQTDELSRQLPAAVDSVRQWLSQRDWGQSVLQRLSRMVESADGQTWALRITGLFSSATTVLAGLLLMLAITLFLAANPKPYVRGSLALVPVRHEQHAHLLLRDIAQALRWWIVGQAGSMTIVGVFTGLGLWLVGVPLPWVLGLIAGLCSFVPNIGPIVAALPGLLLALSISGNTALWAAAVYGGVQLFESNLITPMLQKYAVSVPPALLLLLQMVMGVLFGIVGLIVATPLMVTAIVIIQRLYVRDLLGRDVQPLGQGSDSSA